MRIEYIIGQAWVRFGESIGPILGMMRQRLESSEERVLMLPEEFQFQSSPRSVK